MKTTTIVIAALAALTLADHSNAAVVSTSGAAQLIAQPAAVNVAVPAPSNSSTIARVWNERFDFRLGGPLRVDAIVPGTYANAYQMGPFYIDRFEHVSSHFIHLNQNANGPIQASVTFDNDILGVICIGDAIFLGSSLDDSDFLSSGTAYPDGQNDRGLEISPTGDRLQISNDRRTLTFWLDASTSSDSIRVITSVPTPGSLALLGLASLGTARRRR